MMAKIRMVVFWGITGMVLVCSGLAGCRGGGEAKVGQPKVENRTAESHEEEGVADGKSGVAKGVEAEMVKGMERGMKVLRGEIQLSGAFALYPIVVRWAEEFRKLHPEVRIDISAGGAGKGITDALAGVVDLGMVSRDVYPEELEKGAFPIAVVKDAVVPTINVKNPLIEEILATGLKREAAVRMWAKGDAKTWGDVLGTGSTIPVHVYTRSDACGAAETFAAWLGVKQEDLEGTAVFGDPGVTSVVQRDKIGVGFNNIAYAYDITSKQPYDNIAVMPLDLDGNGRIDPEEDFYATSTELNRAIAEGRFPSPPARNLFLVARGIPEKREVVAFLEYILTEGQKFASEVGYVGLSPEILMEELSKLQKK